MSDKLITGLDSIFGGLFGANASTRMTEAYLQALREAQLWLAAYEAAEANGEGWVN